VEIVGKPSSAAAPTTSMSELGMSTWPTSPQVQIVDTMVSVRPVGADQKKDAHPFFGYVVPTTMLLSSAVVPLQMTILSSIVGAIVGKCWISNDRGFCWEM